MAIHSKALNLGHKENSLTLRFVKHWDVLPGRAVESPVIYFTNRVYGVAKSWTRLSD